MLGNISLVWGVTIAYFIARAVLPDEDDSEKLLTALRPGRRLEVYEAAFIGEGVRSTDVMKNLRLRDTAVDVHSFRELLDGLDVNKSVLHLLLAQNLLA